MDKVFGFHGVVAHQTSRLVRISVTNRLLFLGIQHIDSESLWHVLHFRPKQIQTSGTLDIMDTAKDMVTAMALPHKTPTCTMEGILGMEIINSHSNSNKSDIAKC